MEETIQFVYLAEQFSIRYIPCLSEYSYILIDLIESNDRARYQ